MAAQVSDYAGERLAFVSIRPFSQEFSRVLNRLWVADGKSVVLLAEPVMRSCGIGGGLTQVGPAVRLPENSEFAYLETTFCSVRPATGYSSTRIRMRGTYGWLEDERATGSLSVSANGRYGVATETSFGSGSSFSQHYTVDIGSGQRVTIPPVADPNARRAVAGPHAVSDSGKIVLRDDEFTPPSPNTLFQLGARLAGYAKLWDAGDVIDLRLPSSRSCALDPRDRYVACITDDGRLIALDLMTREQRVFGLPEGSPEASISLSADGDRLLLNTRTVSPFVFAMPNLEGIYHAERPAGTYGILSGSGRMAFLFLPDRSIERLDMETSTVALWVEKE